MTTDVKLSQETMDLLKNFASINPGLILEKGNTIKTIAISGNIFAEATITEEIPSAFGFGNLAQFIQTLTLPYMADAGLDFTDKYVDLKSASGDKIRYYRQEDSCIVHIDKSIQIPSKDFEFELTSAQLANFLKTASILKAEQAVISVVGGKLTMRADTPRKESSHQFTLKLGDVVAPDVEISFDIKNFLIMDDDYTIAVKTDFGMELTSKNRKLRYIIAGVV